MLKALLIKQWHAFARDRLWLWSTLLFPWVASSILQVAMGDRNPARYWFFCIIFCYWFFLNLGVRTIVGEKRVIQREFYAGLSRWKYLLAKALFYNVVCLYMATVFSISVSVEWLDWRGLNTIYRAQSLDWIHDPIDLTGVNVDSPVGRELSAREEQQYEYRSARTRLPLGVVFAFKRLRNDNGWGSILVKTPSGWELRRSGSDHVLDTQWPELKKEFNLVERIGQQLFQLLLLDYAFLVFFLAGSAGLSLGLLISASSRTTEFAVQLVPYVTLCQIVLSKYVIDTVERTFVLLTGLDAGRLRAWDFGSILSLLTTSRPLQCIAEQLLPTAKTTPITWSVLPALLQVDFLIVAIWVLAPIALAYITIRRWQYAI
ncbi:ABC transporter permease [Verrucomicrobiota bacterium]